MTKRGGLLLAAAACLICLLTAARGPTLGAQGKNFKYASERRPYPFAGATRVVLEGFDPTDKDATSAMIHMDKNEVSFSPFGDARITAVLYKPFAVKLTRLEQTDPTGMERRIFSVTLPQEFSSDLGKNVLRLVTSKATKSEPTGVRLLLVSPGDKVTQVLELRPMTN